MTLHLDISPQAENALREFARTQGCSVPCVISALVEEMFAGSAAPPDSGDVDAALSASDFAVLADLLGSSFARCVAPGVMGAWPEEASSLERSDSDMELLLLRK
jgi:hypothetical protein